MPATRRPQAPPGTAPPTTTWSSTANSATSPTRWPAAATPSTATRSSASSPSRTASRSTCPNAARLIENYPYRIQKVRWKETSTTSSFQTTVKVITDDSAAYSSVIKTVTDFGASLRSSSMTPRAGRSAGEFDIRMQIFVSSNSVLDKIISAIRKTRGPQDPRSAVGSQNFKIEREHGTTGRRIHPH